MRLLLDTHILLWALFEPDHLDDSTKQLISDPRNEVHVSVASIWEVEIKHLKFPDRMPYSAKIILDAIDKSDFLLDAIQAKDIVAVEPFAAQKIHSDPFDHILMATAAAEDLLLITQDEVIKSYKGTPVRLS